jgi:hypothetical protein
MVSLREVFDHEFQPYAIEIGFFVRDWNYLHELLRNLFESWSRGTLPLRCGTLFDMTELNEICSEASLNLFSRLLPLLSLIQEAKHYLKR